ncbi:MAG: SGNH/GDSL hydrolase family protein [Lachnospiraceae bacterium]|nr:SGNH/GDSL hydrolase family protein [Lachnospiraceae bacterium]
MKEIFKKNSVVLFQGDSVTDCGRLRDQPENLGSGYPEKVARVYRALFPESGVKFYNRGVSGDRSKEVLERMDQDILQIAPDYISIMVGINDVWRRYDSDDPTSAQQFEKNYRTILEGIKRDLPDTKIMMMEPYVLDTLEFTGTWREDLDPKLQVVRKLAAEYADYFMPTDGIIQKYLVAGYTKAEITADGVHPTDLGHGLIAGEYLGTWGLKL